MREFLTTLLAAAIDIGIIIAIAKYLIRYAAKVFAEEFENAQNK